MVSIDSMSSEFPQGTFVSDIRNGDTTRHGMFLKQGRLLEDNTPTHIVWSVRKSLVRVTVSGKEILRWDKGFGDFTIRHNYRVPNPKVLVIASFSAQFKVTRLSLTAKSGRGRVTR